MPKLTRKLILAKLERNKDLLREYSVTRIGLFGSYKKGKQKAASDIDLLVKFENPTFDNYMDLKFDLEKVFKKKIDLVMEEAVKPGLKYIAEEAEYVKGV